MVFDDSSPANQEKYYSLLERTTTRNELYYVGPREKEQFIAYLNERLPDKRLQRLEVGGASPLSQGAAVSLTDGGAPWLSTSAGLPALPHCGLTLMLQKNPEG